MKKKGNKPFARKRFGQNFLTDNSIVQKIVDSAELSSDEHVIEIGPGRGKLTIPLINTGVSLTLVEIDRDLVAELEETLPMQDQINLVQGDILKCDWKDLIKDGATNKIIANLPYNISSPLFFKLVRERHQLESITIMVQKELAERILHDGKGKKLKDYGILSVVAGNTFHVKKICSVSSSCFTPRPKVESTVIQLTPIKNYIKNEQDFFQFVKKSFNGRRKLFLTHLKKNETELYEELSSQTLQFLHNLRPENLLPEQYLKLYQEHNL